MTKQDKVSEKIRLQLHNKSAKKKFKSVQEILEIINSENNSAKKVVVSSGTFLLPHFGHADYFEKAKEKGDMLIVCINSDESIKMNGRCPHFVPIDGRIVSIASLESVDYIVVFNEKTPERILGHLKPDIYTKGEDWKGRYLPEEKIVKENNGRVEFVDCRYNFSSSMLVKNIKKFAK